jgi:hypothetical protein
VPDNLKPSATETLARHAQAAGDQIYTCDGASWVLTGPNVKLFDESGNSTNPATQLVLISLCRHGKGPTAVV